ncbi:MAG: hypothetical protein CL609_13950 [Anaerolineaceae bacterium]|nr:hypothetical protein [Anaerolineaceae bacterium]
MAYKVFLVEDEIVTREGIRDNVDWKAAGFEFCGEASNGELALPLLDESKPDVLITDIKMPHMDGLQLSKIVRKHMPWIKVIILSGHDEFNFAQSAIKLGVTEYLLKPVSSHDLHITLTKLALSLDQEKQEREQLKSLKSKLEDNFALTQEKFLIRLVTGGISSTEAVELSLQLGLDIISKFYLVMLIKIEPPDKTYPYDFQVYKRAEQLIFDMVKDDPDLILAKKEFEDLVLFVKGDSLEQITQESLFRADLFKNIIQTQTGYSANISIGSPQERLGAIHHSFAEALILQKTTPVQESDQFTSSTIEIPPLDHKAIENYLRYGAISNFDDFFSKTLETIGRIGLQIPIIKQYLFVDLILTLTQFISDVDNSIIPPFSDINSIQKSLSDITTIEQIQERIKNFFNEAINVRKLNNNNDYELLNKIEEFIHQNFQNADLKMSDVSKIFNLSPSYFSAFFKEEVGVTFRDYICDLRIEHAKNLLVSTHLKSSVIAYKSGYNDPHYFSFIFKKKTGKTPKEFRNSSEDGAHAK